MVGSWESVVRLGKVTLSPVDSYSLSVRELYTSVLSGVTYGPTLNLRFVWGLRTDRIDTSPGETGGDHRREGRDSSDLEVFRRPRPFTPYPSLPSSNGTTTVG